MRYSALGNDNGKHGFYTGVAIIYEEKDAVGVYDLLRYMIKYDKLQSKNKNPTKTPYIYYTGEEHIEPIDFLEFLEEISIAPEGILPDCMLVQFTNDDKKFFQKYVAHLLGKITSKNKDKEIDEDHPLFYVYDFFLSIRQNFFPPRETMN